MKKNKKTKKISSSKRKQPHVRKEWIMPFNASFPGQDEVSFLLEEEDEDSAIVFQFETDSEE